MASRKNFPSWIKKRRTVALENLKKSLVLGHKELESPSLDDDMKGRTIKNNQRIEQEIKVLENRIQFPG